MLNHHLVAIVDDDESVRLATSSLVRSLGWEVRLFASAVEFLDSGRAAEVACVISDIQMPGMTGLEMQEKLAARRIRVPVIFITAFSTNAIRKQAMDCGALSFLCKPVDGVEVRACLDRVGRVG